MRRRFFLRKFLQYSLFISIPLFMLSFFVYVYAGATIQRDMNLAAKNKYALGRQYLESILDIFPGYGSLFNNSSALTRTITGLLNSKSLSYADSNNMNLITSILNNYSNTRTYIDSIYIYADNKNGYFLRSGYGLSTLSAQSDIGWYERLLEANQNDPFWICSYEGRYYRFEAPRRMVSAYYRLSNISGVIVINLNVEKLRGLLDSLMTYQDEMIFATDEKGNVLFGNTKAEATLDFQATVEAQVKQKQPTDLDGMFHAVIGENRYIMIESPSDTLGIGYYSLISTRVLYALLERILLFTLIAAGCDLLVSLCLSYLLTRKNYRQVKHVINTIAEAESGRYVKAEPARRMDEFDLVLNNVIDLFLRNSYLQLQVKQLGLEKQLAEFRSLQLQINPHFLYNTLQVIDMHLRAHHSGEERDIISYLSDILRYSLEISHPQVALSKEIDISKRYLDIQRIRYPGLFSTIWDYEDEMLQLPIMRLLLQPILENALQHGIIPANRRGIIKVRFETARGGFYVHVLDNGVGIDEAALARLRAEISASELEKDARHIGLWNVNKRLVLTYSEQSALKVFSRKGKGTGVHFFIPHRK